MTLSVKNRRAYELASELSKITGASLTSAVIDALESRLAEVRGKRANKVTAEKILSFGRHFSTGMAAGSKSSDHDFLYNKNGS